MIEASAHSLHITPRSYGGHYGPEFISWFSQQNNAIASGSVTGEKIDLVALGINNGWYDPTIQYRAYVDFSYNNSYNQILSAAQHTSYLKTYTNQCAPQLTKCTSISSTAQNSACENADNT